MYAKGLNLDAFGKNENLLSAKNGKKEGPIGWERRKKNPARNRTSEEATAQCKQDKEHQGCRLESRRQTNQLGTGTLGFLPGKVIVGTRNPRGSGGRTGS